MLNNSQAKTLLLLYLFTFVFVQGINIPIKNTPAIGPAIALEKVPSICNMIRFLVVFIFSNGNGFGVLNFFLEPLHME